MNKTYKVAIIGGGAAGLFCAAELLSGKDAGRGEDVLILERNERVGKKLSATGNGQGNLTNLYISEKNYSGDTAFISAFIKNLKTLDLIEYFKNFGVYTQADEDGRVYPLSRRANAVTDAVRAYLDYKGAKTVVSAKVVKIEKNAAGGVFTIIAENGERFFADRLVIAAGGKAAKQFGTDGSAYILLESLGYKITPLSPSLVQVKTEKEKIKALKGIKERAAVSLFDGEKFIKRATGDLLFTEYGVSGNAVFSVSDKIAETRNPVLSIGFLPDLSEEELSEIISEREKAEFIAKNEILTGLVHKKLGQVILNNCGKNPSLAQTVKAVKNFRLQVTGTLGFDYAQVTKGGVTSAGVNPETFESKTCEGLFVIGETLNVDGECGGYNLTFAFASGIIAARNIKNNLI